MAVKRRRSCVIIVENLPVPFDRRVWQEAQALNRAGWLVSVICPNSKRYPLKYEMIDGIAIYRHSLPFEARSALAFLLEYAIALAYEFRLLLKVHAERGFSVIQACNPPDLIFLVTLPFKLFGKLFVFDQHDVAPELYVAKFGRKGFFHRMLLLCEWLTFKSANMVISANETFREIAIDRGGKRPEVVETVYSIPDARNIYRTQPQDEVRKGRKFVLGYLGIIGDQDGVDHMVRAVNYLVRDAGFTDFQAVVIGDGPALASVRALARQLDMDDHITFTGYLSGSVLMAHVSAFDVGLIPDPVNETNDMMSMNKVFEYSALGIPIVSYRLKETMRLLGDAAIYAQGSEPKDLALACLQLMRDDELRMNCGTRARDHAQLSFSWEKESQKYVNAYERLIVS